MTTESPAHKIPIEILNLILSFREYHPTSIIIKNYFIEKFAFELIESGINSALEINLPQKYNREDIDYLYECVSKYCWYPYSLMIHREEDKVWIEHIIRDL